MKNLTLDKIKLYRSEAIDWLIKELESSELERAALTAELSIKDSIARKNTAKQCVEIAQNYTIASASDLVCQYCITTITEDLIKSIKTKFNI